MEKPTPEQLNIASEVLTRGTYHPVGEKIGEPACHAVAAYLRFLASQPESGRGTASFVDGKLVLTETVDLATAPLKAGNFVRVVGPSWTQQTDRPEGPWEILWVSPIDGSFELPDCGYMGICYERSSLHGPVAPPDPHSQVIDIVARTR